MLEREGIATGDTSSESLHALCDSAFLRCTGSLAKYISYLLYSPLYTALGKTKGRRSAKIPSIILQGFCRMRVSSPASRS